ncbi:Chitooligosaccharide deacetylase [Diplonema papillatum]|nr:Chitooligosaccharide deacetylase [Diplonema papillatum]
MRLIVVADDFGVNRARSEGVIEALLAGVVTSVSALANGECTGEMLREASRRVPGFGPKHVGAHLNVTEGAPVGARDTTLTENGRFLGKVELRRRLARGQVDVGHVVDEIRAQTELLRSELSAIFPAAERLLTHCDGHNHFHTIPELVAPVARAVKSLGFRSIRVPNDAAIAPADYPAPKELAAVPADAWAGVLMGHEFHIRVVGEAVAAAKVYREVGLAFPAVFAGLTLLVPPGGKGFERCGASREAVVEVVQTVAGCSGGAGEVCEVMTHVGHAHQGDCTDSFWHDAFSTAEHRNDELRAWLEAGPEMWAVARPASFDSLAE